MTTDNQRVYNDAAIDMLAAMLDSMRPRPLSQIKYHPEDVCAGEACCIHNPSDHALNEAPLQLRADRSPLMERVCLHGIGHPDPDSLDFIDRASKGVRSKEYEGVHGCDGCCQDRGKTR